MGAVAIRLDDIHGRTPLDLLRNLDLELWRGKPVTYAVIPYPAPLCLGPTATAVEQPAARSTIQRTELIRLLHVAKHEGSDIALHGLTHADHKSAAGPAVPELVAIRPPHAEALARTLEKWLDEFDTRVLVPPHNAIDADLARTLVNSGNLISTSITEAEVAALGFDTTPTGRSMAKLVRPDHRPHSKSQFFQTVSVSERYIRTSRRSPQETASIILHTAREAGNATLTLHWWDFTPRESSSPTWAYVAELLDYLSQHSEFVPIRSFSTASQIALLGSGYRM